MTPFRRLCIRVSLSSRHRPFWLPLFLALQLILWGWYTQNLLLHPLRGTAFALLGRMPDGNRVAGAYAMTIGGIGVLVTVLNVKILRAIADVLGAFAWASLYFVSEGGMVAAHPGIVLYVAPVIANAFDFSWLVYDLTRRR